MSRKSKFKATKPKVRLFCTSCKKPGHDTAHCYALEAAGVRARHMLNMNSKRTLRDNSEKDKANKRVKRFEKASTPSSSSSLEVIADMDSGSTKSDSLTDIGRPSTPAAPTVLDYMAQHNEINELRPEVAGLKERMTKLEKELEVPME